MSFAPNNVSPTTGELSPQLQNKYVCPGRDCVVEKFSVVRKVRTELQGHFRVSIMSFAPTTSMAQLVCCPHNYRTNVLGCFCLLVKVDEAPRGIFKF